MSAEQTARAPRVAAALVACGAWATSVTLPLLAGLEPALHPLQGGALLPLAVSVLAGLALAVLVPLAVDRPIPTGLLIALALGPLVAGEVMGLRAAAALQDTAGDPALIAQHVRAYLLAHHGGASASMVLATGLSISLALASIAHPHAERREGAILGVGLGLVLVSVCLLAGLSLILEQSASPIYRSFVVALFGVPALGLAGAGASVRRARELASGAALALSVALMCAPLASSAAAMFEGFMLVGSAAPEVRVSILFAANAEIQRGLFVGLMVFAGSLLAPALFSMHAHRGRALRVGAYVGGAVSTALVGLVLLAHVVVSALAPAILPGDAAIAVPALIP